MPGLFISGANKEGGQVLRGGRSVLQWSEMKYMLAGVIVMILAVSATGIRHKYRQPKRGQKQNYDDVSSDTDFDFIE